MYRMQARVTNRIELHEEDPVTLGFIDHLASLHFLREDCAQAEILQQKVCGARERILGNKYPDTLHSMASLIKTYNHRDSYKKAREMGELVMERLKRVLGETDCTTLASLGNLEMAHYKYVGPI